MLPDPLAALAAPSALEKVQEAIAAAIRPALSGVNVTTEATDQAPLDDSELPAVVVRMLDDQMGPSEEQGQWRHTVAVQFDCISGGTASLTIDKINQRVIATIVGTIGADPTLGGRLEDLAADYADASEQSAPDAGWAVLQMNASYHTPAHDLFTIVGQSGEIF